MTTIEVRLADLSKRRLTGVENTNHAPPLFEERMISKEMMNSLITQIVQRMVSSIQDENRKMIQQEVDRVLKTKTGTKRVNSCRLASNLCNVSAAQRTYRSTLNFSNVTPNSILTDKMDYSLRKEKLFTEFRSRGFLHFVD